MSCLQRTASNVQRWSRWKRKLVTGHLSKSQIFDAEIFETLTTITNRGTNPPTYLFRVAISKAAALTKIKPLIVVKCLTSDFSPCSSLHRMGLKSLKELSNFDSLEQSNWVDTIQHNSSKEATNFGPNRFEQTGTDQHAPSLSYNICQSASQTALEKREKSALSAAGSWKFVNTNAVLAKRKLRRAA